MPRGPYNLPSTDTAALEVTSLVKTRFSEATNVVGPVGNIFSVFFRDLVVHFTCILMHRNALRAYDNTVHFPFVNQAYALSPYNVDFSEIAEGRSRTPKLWLRELRLTGAAIGEALPFGYCQDRAVSKFVNLLGSYQSFSPAYLPHRQEQIDWLLDTVDQLCWSHAVPNREAVCRNWKTYIELHTIGQQTVIRERGLILGSRNNLQNRKLAINYLQQEKEVVAITHGEAANSIMDEPPFGYSERTLCSTLVDYGDFDQDGELNTPLFMPTSRFYRSSRTIAKNYHRCDGIRLPDRRSCRALYLPTLYAGNDLYGPFHYYEDFLYQRWQDDLFDAFPNLTFKVHPKSKSLQRPLIDRRLEFRQLEECIQDYDLFVFDRFATSAILALMSDKCVIYFDIGLRKLHPQFEIDLKERCKYSKISLAGDVPSQVKTVVEDFWSSKKRFSNDAMAKYCLCKEDYFSWMDLFLAVSAGSPPPW